MKTKIVLISFLIAIIACQISSANNDSLSFKKSIISKITYPEFAVPEKLAADVWVKFSINENGKIIINQINCVDVLFLEYVKEELQSIEVDKNSGILGNTYYYKFSFIYQKE